MVCLKSQWKVWVHLQAERYLYAQHRCAYTFSACLPYTPFATLQLQSFPPTISSISPVCKNSFAPS